MKLLRLLIGRYYWWSIIIKILSTVIVTVLFNYYQNALIWGMAFLVFYALIEMFILILKAKKQFIIKEGGDPKKLAGLIVLGAGTFFSLSIAIYFIVFIATLFTTLSVLH